MIKELGLKLLSILRLDEGTKPSVAGYIAFAAAFFLPIIGAGSRILPMIIMEMLFLMMGVFAVVIMKKLLHDYIVRLAVTSGVTIALILLFENWIQVGNFRSAVNNGEVFYSWWGLYLYIPAVFFLLKTMFGSIGQLIHHGNMLKSCSASNPMAPGELVRHFLCCLGSIIFTIIIGVVIYFFFYIGMYSLMIIRAVAELMKIMDSLVLNKKIEGAVE